MGRSFLVGRSLTAPTAFGLTDLTRSLYGSNSPEMKAPGKILRKAWAKVLSVPGGARVASSLKSRKLRAIGGTPSRPGDPPRKQTGQLSKSVAEGPGDAGRIVAVLRYTGPILEAGVDTSLPIRSGKRRRRSGVARRRLVIAARPSRQRAIDLATPDMQRALVEQGFASLKALVE